MRATRARARIVAPLHTQADGLSFFVDVAALKRRPTIASSGRGLAYPTYYRALFPELRNELTAAAKQAATADWA